MNPDARAADDVLRILAGLDHPDGDALRLVYFRGLTHDEVANALGLSRDAVRRCLARGMRELAERLTQSAS